MTLPTLLRRIGWSGPELARRTGRTWAQVRPWIEGRNTRGNPVQPPADVVAWLERVASRIEAEPPPPQTRF